MDNNLDYIDILKSELQHRISVNSSYSLRAFARDINLSPSRLSELLNGKGGISENKARVVAEKIGLNKSEEKLFLTMISAKFARSKIKRNQAKKVLNRISYESHISSLCRDGFQFISDWRHYVILTIMELDQYDGTLDFIQNKFSIKYDKLNDSIQRMVRLGYVVKEIDGTYHSTNENLSTTHDIASKALRNSHKSTLLHAIESLENIDVELRDITSMTVTTSVKKIKEAKELIKNFRRDLADFLECDEKEEVYNLNIQLVPVTKLSKEIVENA